MPEFLVRIDGTSKYARVIAREATEIESLLEENWTNAIVFSIHGQVFQLEPGKVLMLSDCWLPFSVRLAWLGVRFPRVRIALQILCWFVLGLSLSLAREIVPPELLVLIGLANVFAWWWSESDRARIEPGLRRSREH
jgi:hypothetical protein